jgi:hypothetical protein
VALADERASNSEHKLQPTQARQSSTLPTRGRWCNSTGRLTQEADWSHASVPPSSSEHKDLGTAQPTKKDHACPTHRRRVSIGKSEQPDRHCRRYFCRLVRSTGDFYFLQQMRSVERSGREVVEGEAPYISVQIVAMSSRRCSSVSGSTSCRISLITTLESVSGCASAF